MLSSAPPTTLLGRYFGHLHVRLSTLGYAGRYFAFLSSLRILPNSRAYRSPPRSPYTRRSPPEVFYRVETVETKE